MHLDHESINNCVVYKLDIYHTESASYDGQRMVYEQHKMSDQDSYIMVFTVMVFTGLH